MTGSRMSGYSRRDAHGPPAAHGWPQLLAAASAGRRAAGLEHAGAGGVPRRPAGSPGHRTGLSMAGPAPAAGAPARSTGAVPPDDAGPARPAPWKRRSPSTPLIFVRSAGSPRRPSSTEAALVRPFLAGRIRDDGFRDLESLTAADVQAFILDRARSSSPAQVQSTGTALRSLLRFLHLRGVTASPLASAVPAAASWKLAGLPRHLAQGEAARILDVMRPGHRHRAP